MVRLVLISDETFDGQYFIPTEAKVILTPVGSGIGGTGSGGTTTTVVPQGNLEDVQNVSEPNGLQDNNVLVYDETTGTWVVQGNIDAGYF